MAKSGIKTVTVTGISRLYLDAEKSKARKEVEEQFALEGKEIIGYTEALPATFLGFLTQELSFTWRQSDEQTSSPSQRTEDRVTVTTDNYRSILNRIDLFLEDKEWERASAYCEAALDFAPMDSDVYVRYLLADLKTSHVDDLANCSEPFEENENYKKAIRFGNELLVGELKGYNSQINDRNRNAELTEKYINAITVMQNAVTEEEYKTAAAMFEPIQGFQDADTQKQKCLEKAENSRKDEIYNQAVLNMGSGSIKEVESAIRQFQLLGDWRYSKENIEACYKLIDEIKVKEELEHQVVEKAARKRKIIIAIAAPVLVACIAIGVIFVTVIAPKLRMTKAMNLLNSGDYEAAYSLLEKLGEKELIISSKNDRAKALINSGDYEAAYALYRETGNYDSISSNKYDRAVDYMNLENYKEAYLLLNGINYKDSEQILSSIKTEHGKEVLPLAQVGSFVFFGSYEQDNNIQNGKESIEWIVLAKESNRLLLISKYILDVQEYNSSFENVTWDKCTLRKWLNGTFINNAFTIEDKAMILNVAVNADKNPKYKTNPGYSISDQVFLLSVSEANRYLSSVDQRKCTPTEYAAAKDKSIMGYVSDTNRYWWLRSPGENNKYAASVYGDGSIVESRIDGSVGVRPVIWLNTSN